MVAGLLSRITIVGTVRDRDVAAERVGSRLLAPFSHGCWHPGKVLGHSVTGLSITPSCKLLIEHGDGLAKDIDARAGAACYPWKFRRTDG
jgi:hypothetical protein